MDLVAGVKKVVIIMDHNAKSGAAKLLEKCALPLTGVGVVDLVITDLGVFEINQAGMTLIELAPEVNVDEVSEKTEASFKVADNLA